MFITNKFLGNRPITDSTKRAPNLCTRCRQNEEIVL